MNTNEKRQAVVDKLEGIKAGIKGIFVAKEAEKAASQDHVIEAHLADIDALMDGIKADLLDMVVQDSEPTQANLGA